LSKKDLNQTFSGEDTQGQLEECASQYPYNPTAGLVFNISNFILGWHNNSSGSYNMDYMRLECKKEDWKHEN
jgi:hypothetical protein